MTIRAESWELALSAFSRHVGRCMQASIIGEKGSNGLVLDRLFAPLHSASRILKKSVLNNEE
jgi:hypothetical protein